MALTSSVWEDNPYSYRQNTTAVATSLQGQRYNYAGDANVFEADTYSTEELNSIHVPERLFQHAMTNGVQFGSRALGVHTDESDYDVAMLYEDYIMLNSKFEAFASILDKHSGDIGKYSRNEPEHGFHTLIRKLLIKLDTSCLETTHTARLDILVVKTEEDLDVIRSAIQDIRNIPSYILSQKKLRIELYQSALYERGWREATRRRHVRGRPDRVIGQRINNGIEALHRQAFQAQDIIPGEVPLPIRPYGTGTLEDQQSILESQADRLTLVQESLRRHQVARNSPPILSASDAVF